MVLGLWGPDRFEPVTSRLEPAVAQSSLEGGHNSVGGYANKGYQEKDVDVKAEELLEGKLREQQEEETEERKKVIELGLSWSQGEIFWSQGKIRVDSGTQIKNNKKGSLFFHCSIFNNLAHLHSIHLLAHSSDFHMSYVKYIYDM